MKYCVTCKNPMRVLELFSSTDWHCDYCEENPCRFQGTVPAPPFWPVHTDVTLDMNFSTSIDCRVHRDYKVECGDTFNGWELVEQIDCGVYWIYAFERVAKPTQDGKTQTEPATQDSGNSSQTQHKPHFRPFVLPPGYRCTLPPPGGWRIKPNPQDPSLGTLEPHTPPEPDKAPPEK